MDPITLAIAGLLMVAVGCASRDESKDPDGGELPHDGGNIRDARGPVDAPSRVDRYISPDETRPLDLNPSPDAEIPPTLSPDVNIVPSSRLAIFAASFGSAAGILGGFDLETLRTTDEMQTVGSTDVVLRSSGDNLYAIDRAGASIRVYDDSFNFLRECHVGSGTNPQDITILPGGEKAYVSRLDSQNDAEDTADLLIIDPSACLTLGGIDLKPYTTDDGDRLARAAQMVLAGGVLYVVIQDISGAFRVDTNGKVAVVDIETDEVTDVVQLAGRNPADITYSQALGKIFVTNTGVYNDNYTISLDTPYGGIETINPATNESEGIVIDDLDLGGAVSEIRLASEELGYVITDFRKIASFNPEAGLVLSGEIYASPGYFLPDFTIDASGRLVIAEQGGSDPAAAGVVVFDRASGGTPDAPVPLGEPPASLAFLAE